MDDELIIELARIREDCAKCKAHTLGQVRAWLRVCGLEHNVDALKKELAVSQAAFERSMATLQ